MPAGDGLGFLSRTFEDLFRPLNGPFANKEPLELKPPYRVHKVRPEDPQPSFCPFGVLVIKVRTPGERYSIEAIVSGDYMKWAIVESLAEAISKLAKVRVRPDCILPCVDKVEIQSIQTPYLADHLWQFCEFRFDYKVRVKSEEEARKVWQTVFTKMVDFEAEFCKSLETKFREIYHLTVLGLINKRFVMQDGAKMSDELELFKAAQTNDLATVERLVKKGVDVDARQKVVRFPAQILDEDLRFLYVNLGRTPLLAAAEEGHIEAMRILLDGKADVNCQDNSGFHALYLGAGVPERAEQVVNFLLAWGADVNLANSSGYAPLHNACGSGEAGAMQVLLEARADLNLKSRSGAAPIHVAVINDQPAILEALKERRANLDLPAFGGNTPVHEAVMQNNAALIQKLFDLGADINIESGPEHNFATPLKMATDRKKKKAMKKLQELGALEKIEHEYEESEGEFEPDGHGDFRPKVRGRAR